MKISQREARRLKKRVQQLENEQAARINRWRTDYPGGVYLLTLTSLHDTANGKLAAAALFDAALVGRWDDSAKQLRVYAVLPK